MAPRWDQRGALCSPQMPRRAFLATIAGGLLAAPPLAAQAQQGRKVYRVGFISPTSPGPTSDAFRQGLRELGYVEGQNVVIETRFAEGRPERFPQLIAETIGLKVDVLVVGSSLGVLAAKKATASVPIVATGVIDPVSSGIVPSLARPGGNVTGIAFGIFGEGFGGKWVTLLKEAVPDLLHVAALWNSANPSTRPLVPEMGTAARNLNLRLDLVDAGDLTKLDKAFATIDTRGVRGIIVTNDAFFFANRAKIIQFVASKRLPALYFTNEFVDAGGLMSYGASVAGSYRRAATYVDRILKGAKPSDLPFEEPTTFALAINLRTAKALGLTIPPSLLQRADQVIE